MTPQEQFVRAVLESHSSAYHVADTPYQRDRVVDSALKASEEAWRLAVAQVAQALAVNPS